MSTGVYLYAAIDGSEAAVLGPVGVGDPPAAVRVRPFGQFRLVYSELPVGKATLAVEDVRAHQSLLDRLLADHTVLPFSFGTVAAGEAGLDELVGRAGGAIADRLAALAGRVEMGLKVFWQPGVMRREVGVPDPAGSGPTSRYTDAIRVGQLVEERVRIWREQYIPRMRAALSPLCDEIAEGEIVAPTMLWNASFLIARRRQPDLRAAVVELDRVLGSRLNFRLAGPLPPYSFVKLRVAMGREEE